ncbi:MAG: hypothetical protein DLM53_07700 [Candidatus Eremiobacter antarcticus]|nr:MAG: hypothetical protein DLM53_07700 [Candidatus Eremiobacter sp. RRmetagenome_bin22]
MGALPRGSRAAQIALSGLTIAIDYGTLFARLRDRLRRKRGVDRILRVTDVQPLSPTLTVYVIDVDRHRVLLAATPHAVSVCARYPIAAQPAAEEPSPQTV